MIDSYEVVARVAAGFGRSVPAPMTRMSSDGSRRIGMVKVPDCPQEGVASWATVAASFFPTPYSTGDGRPLCVEFVAGIDDRWSFIGDAVAACAFQLGEPNDAWPGTVYRNAIAHQVSEATTPHLLSIPPFLWNDFEPYSDEDAYVTWLQLVPVTEREADYCLRYGFDALEDVFLAQQPDLFSLERADTVPSA